ncbi:cutinase family protein [Candidatus Saccharibacteria bacterium]|nr:cutinase family protein [Candidatus Saccharibacteria bacterium]
MKNLKERLRVSAVLLIAAMLAGIAITISNPKDINAVSTSGCYDVEFIWARGSGSRLGAPEYRAFRQNIELHLAAAGFGGVANFHELGVAENGYPARTIDPMTPHGFRTMIGAKVGAGAMFSYGESVRMGVRELQNYISTRLISCPSTLFALGGYSQGAQVIGDTLVTLPRGIDERVILSTLYGDPKLHLPEGGGLYPDACRGKNLSLYRAWAPICYTQEGVLGGRKPYVQPFQQHKVATYCNESDMICGSTGYLLEWSGHTTYVEDGHFWDGGQRIVYEVSMELPALFIPEFMLHSSHTVTPGQDVAILIDTTASMDAQLNEFSLMKEETRRLAGRVLAGGGRIAMVEYRDIDSKFSNGTPSQILCGFDVCTNMDEINARLGALTARDGDDYDESLLHGISVAFTQLNWRPSASKALVVFTDAGYHDPDPTNGWTLETVQRMSIQLNPVNIYVAKIEAVNDSASALHPAQLRQLTKLAEITTGEAATNWERDGRPTFGQMLEGLAKRPLARLATRHYYVTDGESITFDATNSRGVSAPIAYADWDLDGDGVFEISGKDMGLASLKIDHVYEMGDMTNFRHAQVRIVDENGLSNTASAIVIMRHPEDTSGIYGRMNFVDINLEASKEIDGDGERYLAIRWTRPQLAVFYPFSHYQLYVNGVPLGRLDSAMTSAAIYDLDFSRENKVQVRVVDIWDLLWDTQPIIVPADDGATPSERDDFDWSDALDAIGSDRDNSGQITNPEEPETEESKPTIPDDPEAPDAPDIEGPDSTPGPPETPTSSGTLPGSPNTPTINNQSQQGAGGGSIEVPDTSRSRGSLFHSTWRWLAAILSLMLVGLIFLFFAKRRKKEDDESEAMD